MIGNVYDLEIHGVTGRHPCVVLLEIGGDAVVVPGFTTGGYALEETLERLRRYHQPLQDRQIAVTLDNAVYLQFRGERQGHKGTWIVAQFLRQDASELKQMAPCATMSKEGLLIVVRGLLDFSEIAKDRFSGAFIKKLRQAERRLTATSPPTVSSPPSSQSLSVAPGPDPQP